MPRLRTAPYAPAVNVHEAEYFAQNGVEVVRDESVIVDDAQLRLGSSHLGENAPEAASWSGLPVLALWVARAAYLPVNPHAKDKRPMAPDSQVMG